MPHEVLVLSGGASKGNAHLGALQCMLLRGELDALKSYVGTSVGAIICTLLVSGYSPLEIFSVASKLDTTKDMNIAMLAREYGFMKNTTVRQCLESRVVDRKSVV